MAWLLQKESPQRELAERFRQLVKRGPVVLPGAHDALSALIAQRVGFEALYLSGAAYTASRGLPDLGLVTSQELAERARDIVRATDLPLIVDIDTGFGGVLNVARTGREMVEARVAGVQIEDQEMPKKCGHLSGKSLVTADEMVQKIRALKETAPTLYVIARTDAHGVEGLEAVIARARRYVEAGADAIFPEALTTEDEFRAVREALPGVPLLANLTEFGKTPYYSAADLAAWGYDIILFPVSSLRVAARAVERLYRHLRETGSTRELLGEMQDRAELYETIRYFAYEELDQTLARSTLPPLAREREASRSTTPSRVMRPRTDATDAASDTV